jgi:hypothetical protein
MHQLARSTSWEKYLSETKEDEMNHSKRNQITYIFRRLIKCRADINAIDKFVTASLLSYTKAVEVKLLMKYQRILL